MARPSNPDADQLLRLHTWSLFNKYGGDFAAVMTVACIHEGHETDAERCACLSAVVLHEFLVHPLNRDAVLAAMVGAQEAA